MDRTSKQLDVENLQIVIKLLGKKRKWKVKMCWYIYIKINVILNYYAS